MSGFDWDQFEAEFNAEIEIEDEVLAQFQPTTAPWIDTLAEKIGEMAFSDPDADSVEDLERELREGWGPDVIETGTKVEITGERREDGEASDDSWLLIRARGDVMRHAMQILVPAVRAKAELLVMKGQMLRIGEAVLAQMGEAADEPMGEDASLPFTVNDETDPGFDLGSLTPREALALAKEMHEDEVEATNHLVSLTKAITSVGIGLLDEVNV